MDEAGLTCRHCSRPIAVPASSCPWCGRTIMVICAHCKQYTDDQGTVCQHCGAPLEPDRPEGLRLGVGLDDRVAQLFADRRRARFVASAVIVQDIPEFFYSDGERQTVLVDLFGPSPDPYREAAALLFVAAVFLTHHGYCALRPMGDGRSLLWAEERAWDGQVVSLEGALARQAGLGQTLFQAFRQAIAGETGLSPTQERPSPRRSPRAVSLPPPVAEMVVEVAQRTVLPEQPGKETYRETYRMLTEFVHLDPALARRIAEDALEALTWFRV